MNFTRQRIVKYQFLWFDKYPRRRLRPVPPIRRFKTGYQTLVQPVQTLKTETQATQCNLPGSSCPRFAPPANGPAARSVAGRGPPADATQGSSFARGQHQSRTPAIPTAPRHGNARFQLHRPGANGWTGLLSTENKCRCRWADQRCLTPRFGDTSPPRGAGRVTGGR